MFDTRCPTCEKRLLIFPAQVEQIVNDEQGIVAVYTCWCGARGVERLRSLPEESRLADSHVLAS